MMKRKEAHSMADVIKTPNVQENSTDWFSDGIPALQGELEIVTEGNVTISASRYDTLIRAEHTVELVKKVCSGKIFEYDCERAKVLDLLLGIEMEDE